ncbi:hypothetical protein GF386_05745 [Candidatus Pacearchaeota archaeon]|nr:hypothetical protein [Candidatus Pacearchaeota archaeon]MBD3283597.1 hypothetical protein [Candidatus Pacearchaeota archaeon]
MKEKIWLLFLILLVVPFAIAQEQEMKKIITGHDYDQDVEQYLLNQEEAADIQKMVQIFSGLFFLVIILSIVDLILKGFALWKSSKKDQIVWFICLLIFHTFGILPLIYLLIYRGKKKK